MPWFQRHNGSIVGECRHKSGGGVVEEFLPDDHPDVVAFRKPPPINHANLDQWDRKLKALALVTKPSGMTLAQFKAAITSAYNSLT